MMNFVLYYPSILQEAIFRENPSIQDILIVILSTAVFWAIFINLCTRSLAPLVREKPWIVAAAQRDYKINGKKMQEELGDPKTEDEFVQQFQYLWPWLQLVFFQHLVGGLLCAPSVLGIGGLDDNTVARLACLGVLSEVGWELEDTITNVVKKYIFGDTNMSTTILVILMVHHLLATCLGVPMVLLHGDNKFLHWLCFDLQLAAAIGGFVAEYTKLLNISKPGQLLQFQILSFVALVVMVVTRGFHWFYLCYNVLSMLVEHEMWVFFVFGTLIAIVFTAFNWLLCIMPYYRRFVKFLNISVKHQTMPKSATDSERRQSIMVLEDAAFEMFKERDPQDYLALFVSSKQVTRRATMPPSIRRPSALLGGSSARDIASILANMKSERIIKTD